MNVRHALNAIRSDLGNLDPAVHGEDLAAASQHALDDLAIVEAYQEALHGALIRIEALAGELEGRHTGFVHIGRIARHALRRYDRAEHNTGTRSDEA